MKARLTLSSLLMRVHTTKVKYRSNSHTNLLHKRFRVNPKFAIMICVMEHLYIDSSFWIQISCQECFRGERLNLLMMNFERALNWVLTHVTCDWWWTVLFFALMWSSVQNWPPPPYVLLLNHPRPNMMMFYCRPCRSKLLVVLIDCDFFCKPLEFSRIKSSKDFFVLFCRITLELESILDGSNVFA